MPSTIGRYQVVSCIGEGGMGTVYRAHDPRLGRDVAIKTLLAGGPIGPTFLQRFRREFQVLVSLGEHPNIVTLHDYIEDPPAMVMELLRGEALDVALARARGALPRERVLRIMTHTLEAVGFAHSRGVVHRDLKPANLFLVDLDGTEQVKVMDFGIAALASPDQKLTATGVVLGTVDYMSPEQLMGQPVDARADIYALGIVLYELCTGRVPFTGDSMFSVMNAHVREPLPDPRLVNPALPDDLVSVIEIATAKQAERRFSSCRAMLNALQGALRGPSATTRPAAGAAAGGPAGTSPYPLAGGRAGGGPGGDTSQASRDPLPATVDLPPTVQHGSWAPAAPQGASPGTAGAGAASRGYGQPAVQGQPAAHEQRASADQATPWSQSAPPVQEPRRRGAGRWIGAGLAVMVIAGLVTGGALLLADRSKGGSAGNSGGSTSGAGAGAGAPQGTALPAYDGVCAAAGHVRRDGPAVAGGWSIALADSSWAQLRIREVGQATAFQLVSRDGTPADELVVEDSRLIAAMAWHDSQRATDWVVAAVDGVAGAPPQLAAWQYVGGALVRDHLMPTSTDGVADVRLSLEQRPWGCVIAVDIAGDRGAGPAAKRALLYASDGGLVLEDGGFGYNWVDPALVRALPGRGPGR